MRVRIDAGGEPVYIPALPHARPFWHMTPPEYFCTTIIPTIARPTLARSVESVLSQRFDQPFEIIVINDSGAPLPAAAWQQSAQVRVVDTPHRERSMARNTGAALARGRYL